MISEEIPGTSARASAPSGRADRSADKEEDGRPAAVAAAGTSRAALDDCTFVRMVVYTSGCQRSLIRADNEFLAAGTHTRDGDGTTSESRNSSKSTGNPQLYLRYAELDERNR